MANLVKVVSVTKKKFGKNDALSLEYEHLAGNFKGQVWTINALAVKLPPADRELLLKSKAGDEVVIERESNEGKDKDGNPKTFWALSSVLPPSALSKHPLTEYTKTTNKISSSNNNRQYQGPNGQHIDSVSTIMKKPYDDTGVKVGASRNQAIAFLAATRNGKFTLDDVDKIALEIVQRQAAQEELVRNGGTPTKDVEDHEQDLTPTEEYNDGPEF